LLLFVIVLSIISHIILIAKRKEIEFIIESDDRTKKWYMFFVFIMLYG